MCGFGIVVSLSVGSFLTTTLSCAKTSAKVFFNLFWFFNVLPLDPAPFKTFILFFVIKSSISLAVTSGVTTREGLKFSIANLSVCLEPGVIFSGSLTTIIVPSEFCTFFSVLDKNIFLPLPVSGSSCILNSSA